MFATNAAKAQPGATEPAGRTTADFTRSTDRPPETRPGGTWGLRHTPVFPALQAKLVVGSPDDPLEHEADRVADRVMRSPAGEPVLQRRCAACEDDDTLRAKPSGALASAAPDSVAAVLRSPGQPLDAAARAFFEPRFGRDFSSVRIHADAPAAASADSIGARAYAVGRHIAFARGQYAPGSDGGRRLLAHELTHTIQQGAARIRRQAITGLVEAPEKRDEIEPVTPAEEMVQRSTTWNGATVHENRNSAAIALGLQDSPITWETLNGTMLQSNAAADTAIAQPGITTFPLPSTDPAALYAARVDTVPAQAGGADESVLAAGLWSRATTRAAAGRVTGLAACTGAPAGPSTLTVTGSPSSAQVFAANRRHEDVHVGHCRAAFTANIGAWDTRLETARAAGTHFTGASEAAARANLWAAMGGTPSGVARAYSAAVGAAGGAFHTTAAGGPMALANPTSNADCTAAGLEVTNPS